MYILRQSVFDQDYLLADYADDFDDIERAAINICLKYFKHDSAEIVDHIVFDLPMFGATSKVEIEYFTGLFRDKMFLYVTPIGWAR